MTLIKISPLSKWVVSIGFTFLIFMTLLRMVFFEYFKTADYNISNSSDAFILGLRYDLRIACAIVLPLLLVGSLHLTYTINKKLTPLSILNLILILLIVVFAVLFFKEQ